MKISEAVKQGISRLCLERWADKSYLQLNLLPDKTVGPWMRLVSPVTQKVIGADVPQDVCLLTENPNNDEYVKYTGPIREGDSEWDADIHGVEEIPDLSHHIQVNEEEGCIIVDTEGGL